MFEKVTYTNYSETLGRSAVPDESTFNSYVAENELFIKSIIDHVTERDTDGIDNAVCMMIEESYKADKANASDGKVETSRSLDGFSQSFDVSKAKSVEQKKINWLKLYCYLDAGIL